MESEGLIVQYPGREPQTFRYAVSVVERGGLRHLVDRLGNWVQTVFDDRAFIGNQREHIWNQVGDGPFSDVFKGMF